MASEKVANLAETTLASGYTSGGASITVTSATGFPTAGVFRVRLGNASRTTYRVDSVSGTTFTGGAEANDANAASSDTVVQIASRQTFERLLQSPETGAIHAPSGVSAADFYGPLWKMVPVIGADFAWVNQGTASVTDANGISYLSAPTSTTNVRLRQKTQPATPFTITAAVIVNQSTANNSECGLMLRESATDKMVGLCLRDGISTSVQRYTNVTTIGVTVFSRTDGRLGRLWLRMTHDGTNIVSSFSLDGVNFYQVDTHAKTASFTTDSNQVGYFVCNRSSTVTIALSVFSWIET